MGLYMNAKAHEGLYRNHNSIPTSNQRFFHSNYLADLLKEQKDTNRSLVLAHHQLKQQQLQQLSEQRGNWQEANHQLKRLLEMKSKQEIMEQKNNEHLQHISAYQQQMKHHIEQQDTGHEAMEQQLKGLLQTQAETSKQLKQMETSNQQLIEKIEQLTTQQQEMATALTAHKSHQEDVLERLENQEATLEKVVRQLTNLRSIVFERTSHLVEKVEGSYSVTAAYVYKLLTKSDEPIEIIMSPPKKKQHTAKTQS